MIPLSSSRRGFLGALGAAAFGSVVLRPRCLNAAEPLPELSFVALSDTHLGYQDREDAAIQWERTAAEVAQAPGDLVLHLGDVVDGGREEQYAVYLTTRETIGKTVWEIPGNHDPRELFAKHVRETVDTSSDYHWLRFVLLNNARTDSHDGFLSAEQLGWIDRQCREAAEQSRYVVLCMHVPVHENRHPDRGWHVQPEAGQAEFYEIVGRHQDRILCLLHGHFHNGLRGWEDHAPVHEIVLPSALYNQDRGLEAQGAEGYNPPEFRPGYVLFTIRDGAMTLRYKPVGAESQVSRECALRQLAGEPLEDAPSP